MKSTEIVRTGNSDSEEKLNSMISEHYEKFSSYGTSGYLLGASSASMTKVELGDISRRNATSNNHKLKKKSLKSSLKLMIPATPSE